MSPCSGHGRARGRRIPTHPELVLELRQFGLEIVVIGSRRRLATALNEQIGFVWSAVVTLTLTRNRARPLDASAMPLHGHCCGENRVRLPHSKKRLSIQQLLRLWPFPGVPEERGLDEQQHVRGGVRHARR